MDALSFLDPFWKGLGNIAGLMTAGAVGYFIPQVSAKVKTYMQQRWFNASLKKSVEIKIKLAELKARLNAQRIYVLQFHNGKVFVGDNGFHKYSASAIFEIVSQGLSREIQTMQNIPLSHYAELLYFMLKEKQDVIVMGDHRGTDMSFEDVDLDDVKYNTNSATVVFAKITNKDDSFVGLLVLHFENEITKTKFFDEVENVDEFNTLLLHIKNKI